MEVSKVKGVAAFIKALKEHKKSTAKKVERGLLKMGLLIQGASQRLCPVDTGALKNSARTTKEGKGHETKVHVSYSTAYALHVHERDDLNHEVGQAHFLRDAVLENYEKGLELIKEEIQT